MKKILTLCIIHEHPRILLGLKKRGFGKGKWVGFGGKVEDGEEIETAAIRELEEETSLLAQEIERVGILDFEFNDDTEDLEIHVFRVHDYEGEPVETSEVRPQWFHVDEMPTDKMWADDILWFPLLFSGKKFRGRFLFEDHTTIINKHVVEVDEFRENL
ncbi:MAG: 8-oxo-dGTP diphosphatase [Spirochaetes bacterium]|nr:8-oxo-dGTP diphosphatase [Spirochaetota bacterium]